MRGARWCKWFILWVIYCVKMSAINSRPLPLMPHMTVTLKTGRCSALRDVSHWDTLNPDLQEACVDLSLLMWITWQTGSSWLSKTGRCCRGGGCAWCWSPGGSPSCSVSWTPAERRGYGGGRRRRDLGTTKLADEYESLQIKIWSHTEKQKQ